MKMTRKQAKMVLIIGWSIFAVVYAITKVLLLVQQKFWMVGILIGTGFLIVSEWKAYVKRQKKKK